jgi:hypothetical protein
MVGLKRNRPISAGDLVEVDMKQSQQRSSEVNPDHKAISVYEPDMARRALARKPLPGPSLVAWEVQDSANPMRLSFAIKVF